jgi:preprotein translocase subunit SecD
MVIRLPRFNIILLATAALTALSGCQSPESQHKNQIANLRVHLQTSPMSGRSAPVSVLRAAPITFYVETASILDESHLDHAQLREGPAGFQIALQLNRGGQRLLEQYTTSNPNKRLAIRVRFGIAPFIEDRWLAAPQIQRRIADGLLLFTPDATRQEAEEIVLGLNNAIGHDPARKKKAEPDLFGGPK